MCKPTSIEMSNPARIDDVYLACLVIKEAGDAITLHRLQKMLYFTQHLGYDTGFWEKGYRGVISHWVANIINIAVDFGAVSKKHEQRSAYTYSITKKGKLFLTAFSKSYSKENIQRDERLKTLINYLVDLNETELMLVSSIDYLKCNNKKITQNEIKTKLSYITRITGGIEDAFMRLDNITSLMKTGNLLPHVWKLHNNADKFAICVNCKLVKHVLKAKICYFHPNGTEYTTTNIYAKSKLKSLVLPACDSIMRGI